MADWKDALKKLTGRKPVNTVVMIHATMPPAGTAPWRYPGMDYTGAGEDGRVQPKMPTRMVQTAQGPRMIHEGEATMQNPDGSIAVIPQKQLKNMEHRLGMKGYSEGTLEYNPATGIPTARSGASPQPIDYDPLTGAPVRGGPPPQPVYGQGVNTFAPGGQAWANSPEGRLATSQGVNTFAPGGQAWANSPEGKLATSHGRSSRTAPTSYGLEGHGQSSYLTLGGTGGTPPPPEVPGTPPETPPKTTTTPFKAGAALGYSNLLQYAQGKNPIDEMIERQTLGRLGAGQAAQATGLAQELSQQGVGGARAATGLAMQQGQFGSDVADVRAKMALDQAQRAQTASRDVTTIGLGQQNVETQNEQWQQNFETQKEQWQQGFDETKRKWDADFGVEQSNTMLSNAKVMSLETWLNTHAAQYGVTEADWYAAKGTTAEKQASEDLQYDAEHMDPATFKKNHPEISDAYFNALSGVTPTELLTEAQGAAKTFAKYETFAAYDGGKFKDYTEADWRSMRGETPDVLLKNNAYSQDWETFVNDPANKGADINRYYTLQGLNPAQVKIDDAKSGLPKEKWMHKWDGTEEEYLNAQQGIQTPQARFDAGKDEIDRLIGIGQISAARKLSDTLKSDGSLSNWHYLLSEYNWDALEKKETDTQLTTEAQHTTWDKFSLAHKDISYDEYLAMDGIPSDNPEVIADQFINHRWVPSDFADVKGLRDDLAETIKQIRLGGATIDQQTGVIKYTDGQGNPISIDWPWDAPSTSWKYRAWTGKDIESDVDITSEQYRGRTVKSTKGTDITYGRLNDAIEAMIDTPELAQYLDDETGNLDIQKFIDHVAGEDAAEGKIGVVPPELAPTVANVTASLTNPTSKLKIRRDAFIDKVATLNDPAWGIHVFDEDGKEKIIGVNDPLLFPMVFAQIDAQETGGSADRELDPNYMGGKIYNVNSKGEIIVSALIDPKTNTLTNESLTSKLNYNPGQPFATSVVTTLSNEDIVRGVIGKTLEYGGKTYTVASKPLGYAGVYHDGTGTSNKKSQYIEGIRVIDPDTGKEMIFIPGRGLYPVSPNEINNQF